MRKAESEATRVWACTSRWKVIAALFAVVLLAAPSLGCVSRSKSKKACALFQASSDLNLYDGEPHSITVYIYLGGLRAHQRFRPTRRRAAERGSEATRARHGLAR
ncbi:MAG: hypothetical protein JRH17_09270 [Deltaproteobacteria bacterium]|nr:hypothetical protein [Deltaproteobacteria bacterium]